MTDTSLKIDYIGIDISKHTLEVALHADSKTICYDNTLNGIEKLLSKINTFKNPLIIIEPTGGYETLLEQMCIDAKTAIRSILANRIRDFAKASGQLAKNDRIDAKMILLYGKTFNLTANDACFQRKNPELKALMKRRAQITKIMAQEKNHLENTYHQAIKEEIKEHISYLEVRIKRIEKEILSLINLDDELKEKYEYLTSIKGVGNVMSMLCLSALPELGHISNKQITALVGVVPYVKNSGQYQGQARIYGGRADIRKMLYMASMSAIAHNLPIKKYYEHLRANGKPFKVAMVACMRKLLIMMNCVCKEKRSWQEVYF